jgi:2,3-dihydroxyphenylpropionate 1,2-dioxygenase
MSLVYAGICSHGPGITARADRADPETRDAFYAGLDKMRKDIVDSGAEAIIVIAAEHFANFFMNNMPAFCMGMAETYEGPIEDPKWLKIERTTIPGNPELSLRIIKEVMKTVDTAYSQEWKFDHGISVPLNFLTPSYDMPIIPVNINCQGPPLTPLNRVWAFGEAIRRACDSVPEKIAIVGTGGISHWPATPDSGKINIKWDEEFMGRFIRNDKEAMLSYTDEDIYLEGGQGGYEIRTLIAVAAAVKGAKANVGFFKPIPIFSTSCFCVSFELNT